MKRKVIVIILGLMLLTPSCDYVKSHNPFTKKAREAEALRLQQEAARLADSIRVANENIAREMERQAELARIAEQEALELEKYHVIVGSFLTPEYATAWLNHCNQLGFTSKVVEMDGGRWSLISVGSYDNIHDAWNALDRIQETAGGEAWVFKKE